MFLHLQNMFLIPRLCFHSPHRSWQWPTPFPLSSRLARLSSAGWTWHGWGFMFLTQEIFPLTILSFLCPFHRWHWSLDKTCSPHAQGEGVEALPASRTLGPLQIAFVRAFVDASQREYGDVLAPDIWEENGEELECKHPPHVLEDLVTLWLFWAKHTFVLINISWYVSL